MIKEIIMYEMVCDRCKSNPDDEFSAFCDKSGAIESAESNDWVEINNKDYCPDCVVSVEEGVFIPKPPIPKEIFKIRKIINTLMGAGYIQYRGYDEHDDKFTISGHTYDREITLRPYIIEAINALLGYVVNIEYKQEEYRCGTPYNNRAFIISIKK